MDESPKHYAKPQKPELKDYMQYDSIHMKF